MQRLVLVCGPAGIGKSSFCKKYVAGHSNENVVIVSADETRRAMCGGYDKFPPNKNMRIVYDAMIEHIKGLIKDGKDITILLDTTMLYDRVRLYFVTNLPKFDETVCVLLKLHDYSKCIERNSRRSPDRFVPEDIIRNMIAGYEDPSPEAQKYFDKIEVVYKD